jgi:7,8-dihydro-6-hydroxymethylpterin dimethyltransferase
MARLDERDYTYFSTVRGMCRHCRKIVPARVMLRDDGVWQESLCPDCANARARIAADRDWYLGRVLTARPDRAPLRGAHAPREGCPRDCGPCTWHATPCQLPVVSITNACNLRCPLCFTYNRGDGVYHMSREEMTALVDWVVASSGPVDLINITGGEPTLHPDLEGILACCRRPEIGRVTMNSNGLRLAEDKALCARLAALGVHVILSLSAFDARTSVMLHGRDIVAEKLAAIENLAAAGAKLTLLTVMVRGVNEDAAGRILELMRTNDHILSLTVQTMTYTGQGGGEFPGRAHIPVDEAARIVAESSGGDIAFGDFVTRPSAHPLCYLTCYMLKDGRKFVPFARFAPPERIAALMADSYLLRLEGDRAFFTDAVNEAYARGDAAQRALFRDLVEKLYPCEGAPSSVFERQKIAEEAVRTVYIHTHMDEDTFDCSRAMLCPDLVPVAPGRLVPACTYNLFYRREDPRFYVEP